MIRVALLRGINVGGKRKVEMPRLRTTFERLGFTGVRTYINSGNVIFRGERDPSRIEEAIQAEFGFPVDVLLRDLDAMTGVERALPAGWVTDERMRCDVMFLWEEVDRPEVIEDLPIRPGIDDVLYVPGAVIWRVDRASITRSGMSRLIGSRLYKSMTIRNSNTVRKLTELMREEAA